jgi:hypothetical protein
MRTTSRTILGASLVLALTGCNAKTSPTSEASAPAAQTPNPDSKPTAKATYELDPAKHVIPASPLSGMVGGVEVTPTAALEGEYLAFRVPKPGSPEPEREILLKVRAAIDQPLPEGKRVVHPDNPEGPTTQPVVLNVSSKVGQVFPNGYSMTLELEPRKAGKLAGKIYLCLPDDQKSFLAGTFVAPAPRLPIEPAGLDDVPFINGSVTVVGAAPGTVLITGYAAGPNGNVSQIGIAGVDIELAASPDGPKWTERDDDKPRVTTLIAGDGKNVPSRYEHSKLTPGRYLTFAMLKNGPAAWKWVDIGERTTEKADLTIDAAKVGGLEVTAPIGSLSKIQLAPADDPRRHPIDGTLLELIAMQLKLEQDIVARKALFKNLGPGRYEVRDKASGQVRVVEIVAGKTIELDFDAKPIPKNPAPAPGPKPKG